MSRQWFWSIAPLALVACGGGVAQDGQDSAHTGVPAESEVQAFREGLAEAEQDAEGAANDAADKASDVAGEVADDTRSSYARAKDGVNDAANSFAEAAKGAYDKTAEKLGQAKDATADKAADVRDGAKDAGAKAKDSINDAASDVADGARDTKDAVADKANDAKNAAGDKADDVKARANDVADEAADQKDELEQAIDENVENVEGSDELSRADLRNFASDQADEVKASVDEMLAKMNQSAHEASRATDNAANAHSEEREREYEASREQGRRGAEDVRNSTRELADDTRNVIARTLTSIRARLQQAGQKIERGSDNTWNALVDTTKTTAAYAKATGDVAVDTVRPAVDTVSDTAHWWFVDLERDLGGKISRFTARQLGLAAGFASGLGDAGKDATDAARGKVADGLEGASQALDDASDRVEPSANYASAGEITADAARFPYTLGVEMFADSICNAQRERDNLSVTELPACLAKQRQVYDWWYGKGTLCRENGFKKEPLEHCLDLAPKTAGGKRGAKRSTASLFTPASYKFVLSCGAKTVCAE